MFYPVNIRVVDLVINDQMNDQKGWEALKYVLFSMTCVLFLL